LLWHTHIFPDFFDRGQPRLIRYGEVDVALQQAAASNERRVPLKAKERRIAPPPFRLPPGEG
jgi:hypothetical protein